MRLLDKIFGTNNKIKVQFIDNLTGQTIGVSEMTADQLPKTFSVQTTMHLQGEDWNIEDAIPENSLEFIKTKSLVLKMRKVEKINPNDIWFSLPTISNEFPQLIEITTQTDFDIHIHEDDYRQREFLNVSSLAVVEQEFVGIKDIWENQSKKSDDYTLFKTCFVRKNIGAPNLAIPIQKLQDLLHNNSIGQVIVNDKVLKNGFSLKTENTTFFGTLIAETVTELCISDWNENSVSEIVEIDRAFNLLFVNWYNCDLIKND